MLVPIEFSDNIGEGEMREVKVGEGEKDKVLVSRYKGELYAVGAYCSHFGAPLVEGVLFDDKVLCPYHAAGFSVVTGAVDSAPGLDGVPKYEIVKQGENFFVKVPEDGIKQQKQTMPLAKRDPNDKRNYVIIGGGAAGLNCAETLRQSGFTGKITLVSAEKKLPYDRTLLTKTLPFGDATKFVLRDQAFLDEADIDIINDSVYAIHTDKKKVTFGRA